MLGIPVECIITKYGHSDCQCAEGPINGILVDISTETFIEYDNNDTSVPKTIPVGIVMIESSHCLCDGEFHSVPMEYITRRKTL